MKLENIKVSIAKDTSAEPRLEGWDYRFRATFTPSVSERRDDGSTSGINIESNLFPKDNPLVRLQVLNEMMLNAAFIMNKQFSDLPE